MNPLARLGLRLLGLLLLALTSAGVGYWAGEDHATLVAERAREQANQKAEARLREAERRNHDREREHDQQVSDLKASFASTLAKARAEDQRKFADLRSGLDRLRFPAVRCEGGGGAEAKAGAPTSRADEAQTAELAPEAGALLYGIAAEGDAAIQQLTALQRWAEKAVQLCSSDF